MTEANHSDNWIKAAVRQQKRAQKCEEQLQKALRERDDLSDHLDHVHIRLTEMAEAEERNAKDAEKHDDVRMSSLFAAVLLRRALKHLNRETGE